MSQITPNSSPGENRPGSTSRPDASPSDSKFTPSTLPVDGRGTEASESRGESGGSEPLESAIEASIRHGSPFQLDPVGTLTARADRGFHDVGPWRYTAMGAVAASMLVVAFGAASSYFFPIGGALIAALGCLLSMIGLSSSYRRTAAGLLLVHLMLFVLCFRNSLE